MEYDILGFDISVYNSEGVNLIDSFAYLFHEEGDFGLW